MRLVIVITLALLLAGCGIAPRQTGGDILVTGDSVLAWNRTSGQDTGRVIAATLGRDVTSRATLGAQLQAGSLAVLGGFSIPDQLSEGPWNWVVINGGANDLAATCGCTRCDAVLDDLITPDATHGAIPDLIRSARATGAQVIWVGYYDAPASRSFAGCRPALVEVERRIARYADTSAGVYFIDSEDVLDGTEPALLASDRTHPSAAGSALIGRFIAQQIATAAQR